MEFLKLDLPKGYKCEFMPNEEDMLKIVKDVESHKDSFFEPMLIDVDMYHYSFIEILAKADPVIKVRNQFLVRTGRVPTLSGKAFIHTVTGEKCGYWTSNGTHAEIRDSADNLKGFCRELVFYLGGKGGKGGVNTHWTEFYLSAKVEVGTVICTVSWEDKSIKKQLGTLKAGVVVARFFRSKALKAGLVKQAASDDKRGIRIKDKSAEELVDDCEPGKNDV